MHRVRQYGGSATWMPTVDGDGTYDGGILVAHVGRHLTTVEIGSSRRGPRAVQRLAVDTLRRLG